MTTSLISEVTILPKAAPMITPTARSTTFPRIAKALNSVNTERNTPITSKFGQFKKRNLLVFVES
jgi:hypothetical protein